jgi:hypothetical protein
MLKWQLLTIYWVHCGAKGVGENSSVFYKLLHNIELNNNEKKNIKRARRKFSQISLIVIKSSVTNKLGSSRPCNMCLHAMKILHIKYVYYSNVNGEIIKEKIKYMKSNHISSYQKKFNSLYIKNE